MVESSLVKPSEALNRFSPIEQLPIATQINSVAEEQLRYGFSIGEIGLMMDETLGSEIINNIPICAIPDTPPWFSGVVNLRGNIVPVFDLKMIFNSDEKTSLQKLLVIGKEGKAAGVLIEDLPQSLHDLEPSADSSSIPPVMSDCIHAVYNQNGNIWVQLDFVDFFGKLGKEIIN